MKCPACKFKVKGTIKELDTLPFISNIIRDEDSCPNLKPEKIIIIICPKCGNIFTEIK